ncbi:MAG: hypothetical protein IV100_31690 [Myxococcales bacterium]|nr:hypothetical protein [Myxococcales bacterium]
MKSATYAVALACSASLACSKKEAPAPAAPPAAPTTCAPLKVLVDGEQLTGLVHGLAITQVQGGERSEQVQVFNHAKVTCEQVLSKSGRSVEDGEIDVRANAGKTMMSKGIGFDAHSQLGVEIALMGTAPTKPGDKVTLCAPETTFKPTAGEFKGKSVTVSGTFTGTWCGEMVF